MRIEIISLPLSLADVNKDNKLDGNSLEMDGRILSLVEEIPGKEMRLLGLLTDRG